MAYNPDTQTRPVVSKPSYALLKKKAKKFGRTYQAALEVAIEQYSE